MIYTLNLFYYLHPVYFSLTKCEGYNVPPLGVVDEHLTILDVSGTGDEWTYLLIYFDSLNTMWTWLVDCGIAWLHGICSLKSHQNDSLSNVFNYVNCSQYYYSLRNSYTYYYILYWLKVVNFFLRLLGFRYLFSYFLLHTLIRF